MIYATQRDPQWEKWLGGAAAGALLMYAFERVRRGAGAAPQRAAGPEAGKLLDGSLRELSALIGTWQALGAARARPPEPSPDVPAASDSGVPPPSRNPMLRAAALLGGSALGYYYLRNRRAPAITPAAKPIGSAAAWTGPDRSTGGSGPYPH